MFWEEKLMKDCIELLEPKGDVLEIGFGSGYAANEIQALAPKSHTIIEAHRTAADRARFWGENFNGTKILEGTWQEKLGNLGQFDTIFIDEHMLEKESNIVSAKDLSHSEIDRSEEKVLRNQVDSITSMANMKLAKEDIETMLNGANALKAEYLLTFLYEMRKKGVFNDADLQYSLERGIEMSKFTKEAVTAFQKEQSIGRDYDRLLSFMQECLKNHLKPGGILVTYLDNPAYKAENPEKFNISGAKILDKEVDVKAPEHCLYFPQNKALIVQVKKAA